MKLANNLLSDRQYTQKTERISEILFAAVIYQVISHKIQHMNENDANQLFVCLHV